MPVWIKRHYHEHIDKSDTKRVKGPLRTTLSNTNACFRCEERFARSVSGIPKAGQPVYGKTLNRNGE